MHTRPSEAASPSETRSTQIGRLPHKTQPTAVVQLTKRAPCRWRAVAPSPPVLFARRLEPQRVPPAACGMMSCAFGVHGWVGGHTALPKAHFAEHAILRLCGETSPPPALARALSPCWQCWNGASAGCAGVQLLGVEHEGEGQARRPLEGGIGSSTRRQQCASGAINATRA
jgi:hypothetical protein